MMRWLRKLFSKPTDPGEAYIAKLNQEAKQREAQVTPAPGDSSYLKYLSLTSDIGAEIKASSITAENIVAGAVQGLKRTPEGGWEVWDGEKWQER